MTAFKVVKEETAPVETGEAEAADSKLADQLLSFIMKALSQRVVAIFSATFTCLGLASCWYLWSTILPNPSILQLVGGGMYGVFVLGYEFVRRR